MNPRITALGTAVPEHQISQAQALHFLRHQLNLSEVEQRKMRFLYRSTQIKKRHSVLSDFDQTSTFFNPDAPPTTARRMQAYEAHALPLALSALQPVRQKKELSTISHLITVSCTGMYAPGLDIELIAATELPSHVGRTNINFMGCYAAFNALKAAHAICKAYPEARVLIVGVELCSLHFQPSREEDHILANALFADGAAALVVEAGTEKASTPELELLDFYADLAPEGNNDMGWYVRDYGFEMVLKPTIPEHLRHGIGTLTKKLLQHWQLTPAQIQHWAIHPGGRRILESIEKALQLPERANRLAYQVLENYGNMSSVTIFFVLDRLLRQLEAEQRGQHVVGMAFGPGLTLESGLWRIV